MNKDVIYPSMVIRAQEETINKLEDEVNKQAKAIQIYEKELKKHDNNWNELKDYINRFLYMLNGILDRDIYEQCQLDDFTQIMDKMEELEK